MSEYRSSYTVVKRAGTHAIYRGAIRRRVDDGVIWECEHEHRWPREAVPCAQRYCAAQRQPERRQDRRGEGEEE